MGEPLASSLEGWLNGPLVVSHVFPPIPSRDFDYCAYEDGHEEGGRYGWGQTRDAAVADFYRRYGIPANCPICGQKNDGTAGCAVGGCPIGGDQ